MEDIYAPPSPEEVARMIAELESGACDEARRQARLRVQQKFPHRKMDVGYGLKPRSDRRNIANMMKDGCIVGHIPCSTSGLSWFFLKCGSHIFYCVTEKRKLGASRYLVSI